jgi:hypothetical protein
MLSLPALSRVEALGDLLEFMPDQSGWKTVTPFTESYDPQSYRATWTDTTPMPVGSSF